MTATKRRGASLGTRIFVATALLVVFAVALAVAATYLVGARVGERAARAALERSSSVQLMFQRDRFEQLKTNAYVVASDPAFAAYVRESIEGDDAASLVNLLGDRRDALGSDFAAVVDADGTVLARVGPASAGSGGADLSDAPMFERALDEFEAAGIWAEGGNLYYAVIVPITSGDGLLEGFLLSAYAIDDRLALELREINNTEVAFLVRAPTGPRIAGRTLSPAAADELLEFLRRQPQLMGSGPGDQHQLTLQRQRWLARLRPLENAAGNAMGAVIHLASLDVELEPFHKIGRTLAAVAVLTVLLALAVSYLLSRRVLEPIGRLAEAAAAAAGGDYDQSVAVERTDEIGQLASSFDALLSELREKRDMELYVSQLASTLPAAETEAATVSPPAEAAERRLALLGVELRRLSEDAGFLPPAAGEVLERLEGDLRRLARSVRGCGGRVEALAGHRLLASFEGARRAERALAAAAEIASAPLSASRERVIALVSGAAVAGTATLDGGARAALTGATVEELEALLRVARPGKVLLSSALHDELEATLGEAGVEPARHRSTVSSAPVYSLTPDDAGRITRPELSSTLRLTDTVAPPGAAPTLAAAVRPGSVLGGRFEILGELGAGGMGIVYQARDRTLGELVALKMLRREVWDDAERLERLKDELRLARKITHPNVLRTFDFGEADGYPFISMEFVRGVTLRQILDRSGRLPLSAGLHTARQLCRGLGAAHAQGVLHRDIKPENLIVEPTGKVKLMDFGIARPIAGGGATRPGMVIGTPHYLAPEQLEGEEPDPRSDLYACGVVFYEVFTGVLPFPATDDLLELVTVKTRKDPPPPSHAWPGIPHPLERIILCCLERDRERRFADAGELLAELEGLRA